MKLWLVSQDFHYGYDTYDSFVVVAETEDQARQSAPNPQYHEWDAINKCWRYTYGAKEKVSLWTSWADDPSQVKVEYIGEAKEGLSGVVCASFNAG